nr:T9SS type A sorting domain-containing protein [uncultured Draconibacterium sp.]
MKQKRLAVVPIFLLFANLLFAQQSFEWGVKAGSQGSDAINSITGIGDDIYVTGRYTGTFASANEEIEGIAMTDIYLLKLDRKGNTKWIRSIAGEGSGDGSRIIANENNIYLGGTISGTVKNGKNEYSGEGQALFITSWNKQGKINWFTRLPFMGNATFDVLETAPDGSLLAGGMLSGVMVAGKDTLSSRPGRRAYTFTISPEGELISAVLSSGKGDNRLVAAKYGTNGVQYLLFNTFGWMTYGKAPILFKQKEDFKGLVLVKETNGETNWVKYIQGDDYIEGVQLAVSEDNSVTACINYSKNITLPDTTLSTSALEDVVIVNYSGAGTQNWLKQLKSPVVCYAMDALQTRNGKLLLTGYFRDKYSFGTDNILADNDNAEESMFLVQLDKKGELSWHDHPGEQASAFGKSLTIGSQGDIYMAGGFKNEISFNGEKLTSAGKEDVLVAKYFNCEQLDVTISDPGPLCPGALAELSVSGKSFESFLWNDSVWGETFSVLSPGDYYVEAFDSKGCSVKDTISVEWPELTGLGLPASITVSPGNEIVLTASEGFSDYLWNDGTSGANVTVRYDSKKDSSILILTAETFEGCAVSDSTTAHFSKKGGAGMLYSVSPLKVYPNPVQEELSWYYQTTEPADIIVKLFDDKGSLVYQDVIGNYIPSSVQNIDMRGMVSGNYMLSLIIGEDSFNEKIIKN